MEEPSPRTSRLAIAAGLVVAIALSGAGFLAGRSSVATVEPEAAAPALTVAPAAPPPLPVILDRSAILKMMNRAADAFASGSPIEGAVDETAGRRFDLVIPFGCATAGATESAGPMRWRFDPKSRTLRVTVDPVLWTEGDWSADVPSGGEPTLRGFWVARPWSSATNCAPVVRLAEASASDAGAGADADAVTEPEVEADESALPAPPQTVAIGRTIPMGKSGGNRSYEVVQRASDADFDPELGFRLRIIGRIHAIPGGSFIRCVQDDRSQPPRCLLTAAFSEVRLENAKNGSTLGSWPIEDDVRSTDSATAPIASAVTP